MSAEASTSHQPANPRANEGATAAANGNAQGASSSSAAPATSNANVNGATATAPAVDPKDKEKEKEKEREREREEPTEEELTRLFTAKREEDMARRDRTLAEFLVMLDGYKPLIPEEVTEFYLQRSGFDCSDPRLKRLLSLSAQKFVSDLSRDAYHFAKLRSNSSNARGRPAAAANTKVVLTMDDLSLALGEHGVNVKKPDYYL